MICGTINNNKNVDVVKEIFYKWYVAQLIIIKYVVKETDKKW